MKTKVNLRPNILLIGICLCSIVAVLLAFSQKASAAGWMNYVQQGTLNQWIYGTLTEGDYKDGDEYYLGYNADIYKITLPTAGTLTVCTNGSNPDDEYGSYARIKIYNSKTNKIYNQWFYSADYNSAYDYRYDNITLSAGTYYVEICEGSDRYQLYMGFTPTRVTMYRLYNPNSGEHFYTSNREERDNLIYLGWRNEGVGWIAPASGSPVYRLYNRNGGEHHYTLNVNERNALIRAGWKNEGVGWYSGGKVPVYREYNRNAFSNNHNYTVSRGEHNHLISLGWRNENIGWYAESAK